MHRQNHRIRLRPRDDTLHVTQNRTALATDLDGFIDGGPERGLFVHQTRLLSRYRYLIDGKPWTPLALSNVEQHSWMGYYIALSPNAAPDPRFTILGPGGVLAQQPIELRLSRFVGDGLHEDVDITNFTQRTMRFVLQLEIDADFADTDETREPRRQFGDRTREWREAADGAWELIYRYRAVHPSEHLPNGIGQIGRGITVRFERSASAPTFSEHESVVSFPIEIAPGGTWHACVHCTAEIDGHSLPPLYRCGAFTGTHNEHDRRRMLFLEQSTRFRTAESESLAPIVTATLEQARRDLAALRLYDLDQSERAWITAAGLPIYLAVFGRDTLTAAWQAGMVSTDLMRGTLPELAQRQGAVVDDWRDEQPGKMLHQADTGPLATLGFNPLARYYGSITTSGFYPVVVSELWHWTGDKELVRPFIEPALKALQWLDTYALALGKGFYAYQTRSPLGTRHQAWKDSSDAIVYADGSDVEPPIATCEEQGFVYLAKLHLSEVLWWLDDKENAKRLYHEASELKKRFNDAFWMEDIGFCAMGLDSHQRKITSIGSNPGHCLASAIAEKECVQHTADRLLAADLFSGWGVRTLSAQHPAFNPYSYHRGSVWPVEQATFAIGFMRYGLHEHVEKLCRAQFEAASLFDAYRLPELFSGHARDNDHPFPSHYPGANAPQAWSASATFLLLQSMLGLYPYAPLHMLLLDPHLPAWLPEITLRDLRLGDATATIRFFRKENGASDYHVLEHRGPLHILRQPSPWSLTATFAERLVDGLKSMLPGK